MACCNHSIAACGMVLVAHARASALLLCARRQQEGRRSYKRSPDHSVAAKVSRATAAGISTGFVLPCKSTPLTSLTARFCRRQKRSLSSNDQA